MANSFRIIRVLGGSLQSQSQPQPTAAMELSSLYESTLQLREKYLWSADGCTFEDDYAQSDLRSVHFFAVSENERMRMARSNTVTATAFVVGTVQYDPTTNRLRQLIVDPSHRGQNTGARLVEAVQNEAIRNYQQRFLKVHAWLESTSFYSQQGFVPKGDVYMSKGVPCQVMNYYDDPKTIPQNQ